jgi:hypothetical protein
LATAKAIPTPMPDPLPVMIATLPSSDCSIPCFLTMIFASGARFRTIQTCRQTTADKGNSAPSAPTASE